MFKLDNNITFSLLVFLLFQLLFAVDDNCTDPNAPNYINCSGTCYYYYYDNDGDGVAGDNFGHICSSGGNSNYISGKVTCGASGNPDCTYSDSDRDNINPLDNDDCTCPANNSSCFDACGICKTNGAPGNTYSGAITTSECTNSSNGSLPANCTNTNVSPNVSMDCTGVCSNGYNVSAGDHYATGFTTFYPDTDGDGVGVTAGSIVRCDLPVPSGYTRVDGDPQPNCVTNDEDCNGVCGGSAYIDPKSGVDDCAASYCVGGNTGNSACTLDCNNRWGDGSATNYIYYYDNDGDGVPGDDYGRICSTSNGAAGLISGKVTCGASGNPDCTYSDSDRDNINPLDNDDCYCTTNSSCFDDCGICKGDGASGIVYSGTISASICTASSNTSLPASCTDEGSGLNSTIIMDCAGVCNNGFTAGSFGAYIDTFYVDSDQDGWGDPLQPFLISCSATKPANYVQNNIDIDDSIYCLSNGVDCTGECDSSNPAYADMCGNCSQPGVVASYQNNGNDIFNAANAKYGSSNGVILRDALDKKETDIDYICECNNQAASLADYKVIDCAFDCKNPIDIATNYFYYYDNDGDGVAGDHFGHICTGEVGASTLIQGKVTAGTLENPDSVYSNLYRDNINILDNDNCYCITNDNCFDDCGICKGDGANGAVYSGTIDLAVCTAATYPHPASCSNNSSGLGSTISMDCSGVCNNSFRGGSYGKEVSMYFNDKDQDGWGDPLDSLAFCSAAIYDSTTINPAIPAQSAGYVKNNFDISDEVFCSDNSIDCSGSCGGAAFEDACGNCSEKGISAAFQNNGNDVFKEYNEKYNRLEGVIPTLVSPITNKYDIIIDYGKVCSCEDLNGNTNLVPNATLEDYLTVDCLGVCGGGAIMDSMYLDVDLDGYGYGNLYLSCEDNFLEPELLTQDILDSGEMVSNNLDIDDKVYCSTNYIDDCNICHSNPACEDGSCSAYNIKVPNANSDGDSTCTMVIFPGDVDMNGASDVEDIEIIAYYYGQKSGTTRRSIKDINSKQLSSIYDWVPQYSEAFSMSNFPNLDSTVRTETLCKFRADANGDGIIDMNDILAVKLNSSKGNHEYKNEMSCPVRSIGRDVDRDFYYNIFLTLESGQLKNEMAEKYGFEILPEDFKFYPNYPNPFNPATTFNYEISKQSDVVIKIMNIRGQTIIEEKLHSSPGYYSYTWNAQNFSSGIYFAYVYLDNSLVFNHKLILVK
jgi:hypothetical protein